MAWTQINYTCGHTDRIQLYGSTRLRELREKAAGQEMLKTVGGLHAAR